MLLFKPHHIPLIQAEEKTESRRMWDENQKRVKTNSIHQIKTKIFEKQDLGRIHIHFLGREHLLDITEEGAKREGNYTRGTYLEEFHRIYPDAGGNPMVWVVGFSYLGRE